MHEAYYKPYRSNKMAQVSTPAVVRILSNIDKHLNLDCLHKKRSMTILSQTLFENQQNIIKIILTNDDVCFLSSEGESHTANSLNVNGKQKHKNQVWSAPPPSGHHRFLASPTNFKLVNDEGKNQEVNCQ
jgi:hypothetical protein